MSEHIDQIDAYLDGELPAAEAAELMRWINADASHARAFAERAVLQQEIRTNLHRSRTQTVQDPRQILQELLEHETNAQADLVEIHALSGRRMSRPNQFAALFAMPQVITGIAAAVVLCLSLFLIFQGGSDTPGNSLDPNKPQDITLASKAVATLTAQHNASWAEGALAPGSQLRAGQRLTLTAGFAEITTNQGAVAILEAPATIELLDNDNAVALHAGKLVGICETAGSKGFLVRTSHMDITDLGTRFGVDAISPGGTEVHVFEGEVELAFPPANQGEQVERFALMQGEAARLDGAAGTFTTTPMRRVAFTESLQTHQLAGTGIGLSVNQVDPAWQIVAVDDQVLESPLDMVVSFDDHRVGFSGDTERGRWLRHSDSREPAEGRDEIVYTVQTDLWIPGTTDLDVTTLQIFGYMDDNLSGIRFNGLPAAGLVVPSYRTEPLNYAASLKALGLTHGKNRVQLDLANKTITATGLLIQWQLVTDPLAAGGPDE